MRCPVCSIAGKEAVVVETTAINGSERMKYRILSCTECRSQFADPPLEAPPEFYGHEVPKWRWEFGEIRKDLNERLAQGSSVLEIGCNEGNCLAHLDHTRYNISGIDVNIQAVGRARQSGFCCSTHSLEELAAKGCFNLIYFFHVLEHVPDPYQFLQRVSTIL